MPSKAIITVHQHKVTLIIYSYSIPNVESHCPPSYEKGYKLKLRVTLIHKMVSLLQQPAIMIKACELKLQAPPC